MSAGGEDEPFLFEWSRTTVDLIPLARRAISLFAPSLKPHEREICTLIAEWMAGGHVRIRWPNWAQGVSKERREALALRVFFWVVWLSRLEYADQKMRSSRFAPVTQIDPGVEACEKVRKLATHLYAVDDPPLVPLGGCRKLRCGCILKTMTHDDLGATGRDRIVIVARRKTPNGTIVEIGLDLK